jgi:hypothetical protein
MERLQLTRARWRHTTIEKVMQAVFSIGPLQGYMTRPTVFSWTSRQCGGGVEYSTVALRVVGCEGIGNQCLGYNWATRFLRDINTGTCPSRLGESRIWDSKMWSRVPRDSDLRMTALVKPATIVNDSSSRQRGCYILVRTMNASVQLKIKTIAGR